MNSGLRSLTLWILFILLLFTLVHQVFNAPRSNDKEVKFSDFVQSVQMDQVQEVTIQGSQITGTYQDGQSFKTFSPEDPALITILREKGVAITAKPEAQDPWWKQLLFSLVPILLLVGVWVFFMRQMQMGGGKAMSFGKSRAHLLTEQSSKVTFKDVAGIEEAKAELEEIIGFLKDPKKYTRLGGRIPKGVLLVGSPGTGKTLLAKAIAGEAGVPFFSISGSDFVEMFVGVGASVTGDTPILIRTNGETQLIPVGEFVDRYYEEEEEGFMVSVSDVETLGFEERDSKFKGSPKLFVKGSAWKQVQGVYRHRITEICEIHYLGGIVRTTVDHSLFIRTRNGIKPVAACDLKSGDVLVNLPLKVRGEYLAEHGTPHTVRAHEFAPLVEPLFLDIYEHQEETEAEYAFAMAQQGMMSQAAIAAVVGVSQATVGHWQTGKHQPRALSPNYTDTVLPERISVTPDLMKLFGYYTAEGRENGCLEFTFGRHETDLHSDCVAIGERLFGIQPKVKHTVDNSTKIIFYSAPLGRFFAKHCGTGSHSKHVPGWLWDLPREYFEAYLEGYARGDGYTTPEGKLSMTSVSHPLILELTWLAAMHGIKVGVRHMQLPDQGKKPIVREVLVKPFDGYVYDLCGCENEAFFGGEKPVLLHNSRVRDLFIQGKKNAPCIIFIDEIDAVGRHRGAGLGGGHDEREQTLNQLLVEMDGFESKAGVILIAATNRPDVLDPALLRPGRFDRQVVVPRPDVRGREEILKVHSGKTTLSPEVSLAIIAKGTPGFTGADLENLVNEAALLAARGNKDAIGMSDFEKAKDKVLMGAERKSMIISEKEKRTTAVHEAGHTLVAKMIPGTDPVHKVSIIPRGMALGVTQQLPEEDRYTMTEEAARNSIAVLMGGRAAEEVVFSTRTTGAGNDIEKATELARKMVCEWGMSPAIGPLAFGKKEEAIFLGKELSTHKDYSESTAQQIDHEIRRIVHEEYERAKKTIQDFRKALDKLAEVLLEREVIEGSEIDQILRQAGVVQSL